MISGKEKTSKKDVAQKEGIFKKFNHKNLLLVFDFFSDHLPLITYHFFTASVPAALAADNVVEPPVLFLLDFGRFTALNLTRVQLLVSRFLG